MKKYFLTLVVLAFLSLLVGFDVLASAQDIAKAGLDQTNAQAQLSPGDPAKSIGAAISILLSVMGLIFLIIVVYAGIVWMTASGESAKVEKARKMLIEGALGLAVTLSAYAFTAYVVARVGGAVG